jgi:hypothetical protein
MLIVSGSLQNNLSRYSQNGADSTTVPIRGIATELPANIRRRPILDANEAEVRSVSSDMFDKDPAR